MQTSLTNPYFSYQSNHFGSSIYSNSNNQGLINSSSSCNTTTNNNNTNGNINHHNSPQSHSHLAANSLNNNQYSLHQQYNSAYCNGIMSGASSSSSSNDNESSLGYSNAQIQYPNAMAAASSAAWYSSQSDPRFASKLICEKESFPFTRVKNDYESKKK
jgi:hypothetical protein